MTTENETPARTAPSVPPVPPPPVKAPGSVDGPATDAASGGEGARAGAVKTARAALAAARNAAKRAQAAAGGDPDAIEETSAQPAVAGGARPKAAAPRPEMHYTAAPGTTGVHPGGPVPPAGGYGGGFPGPGQPGPQPAQGAGSGTGPRRVRLTVSRVDPWSVMKLAFLLAVAVGIMTVVASAVFWFVIDGLGVFATIQDFITEAVGQQTDLNLTELVAFDRVVSLATLVAVVNVVLLTAIATIMALLYNITAALVGGVHVTLTDD